MKASVPWARSDSEFTLLFEAFALALIEREMPVVHVSEGSGISYLSCCYCSKSALATIILMPRLVKLIKSVPYCPLGAMSYPTIYPVKTSLYPVR
ncbi:MAG: transposase family protein [Pseudomonadota bacterium]